MHAHRSCWRRGVNALALMLDRLGAAIQSAVDDMCVELVKIEAEELAAAAVEGKGIMHCAQTPACGHISQAVERV